MDEVIERIKEYALVLDESLIDDERLLNFTVEDVVDRALVYMNRAQLIDEDEDFLPRPLERALARVVLSSIQTTKLRAAGKKEFTQVDDNGQAVRFSGNLSSSFGSLSDKELFGDTRVLLDKYRLATVV